MRRKTTKAQNSTAGAPAGAAMACDLGFDFARGADPRVDDAAAVVGVAFVETCRRVGCHGSAFLRHGAGSHRGCRCGERRRKRGGSPGHDGLLLLRPSAARSATATP